MSQLRIPAPHEGEEKDWVYLPIVRIGKIVPFGYKEDPNDRNTLLPIESELKLLEQAKKHLEVYSLRDVAQWLSEQSGRSISHTGLDYRIKAEQKKRREGLIVRQLVKEYEKAIKKAKRIEDSALGRKGPCPAEA